MLARTWWAWVASRSARSIRSQSVPSRRKASAAPRGSALPSSVAADGCGRRGIGWPDANREQCGAPLLRGGLQQRLDIDVERAEADPQPVQRVAVGLVERRRAARRWRGAGRCPPASTSIAASARTPGLAVGSAAASAKRLQRGKMPRDLAFDPSFEPGAKARRGGRPTGGRARARCAPPARAASGRARAGRGYGRPSRWPAPPASSTSRNSASGASHSAAARRSSSSPRRRSAAASSRRLSARRAVGIDPEFEAGEMPDRLRPDADFAVGGDRHRQRVGAARADVADQHRGAAVDEALGQPLVERVADSRASTARVRSAHLAGSASQSERWAI